MKFDMHNQIGPSITKKASINTLYTSVQGRHRESERQKKKGFGEKKLVKVIWK